jgi:hypothetical protein
VAKLIDLPDNYLIGPMVTIRKKVKKPWTKPRQLTLDELVVKNKF